jgi:hypothetical protein
MAAGALIVSHFMVIAAGLEPRPGRDFPVEKRDADSLERGELRVGGSMCQLVVPTVLHLYPCCYIRLRSHRKHCEFILNKRQIEPDKVLWIDDPSNSQE